MQDWGEKLLELHGQLVKQVEPKIVGDPDDYSNFYGVGGGFI